MDLYVRANHRGWRNATGSR